jgi:cyanate permease
MELSLTSQGFCYWMLGALCNTPKEAARFTGVYKTMQCVGAAIAFRLTANHLSGMKQFISNWAIIFGALIVALPAVLRITEPTETEAKGHIMSEEDDRPGASHKA